MFVALAVLVPIIDQITKAVITHYVPEYHSVTIIPGLLAWTHVRNPGAAFGLLPFQRPLFIAVASLLVVAAAIFRKRILSEPPLVQIALGLGLGGAVGNLMDRLRTGYVTDFIEVPFIPIFNIADMAIVFGVGILLWTSFFMEAEPAAAPEADIDHGSQHHATSGGDGESERDE